MYAQVCVYCSHLAYLYLWIWLDHALPHGTAVELDNATILGDEFEVASQTVPYTGVFAHATIRIVAFQPNEIEVTHDWWPKCFQHLVLAVEIRFKDPLVRATGRLSRRSPY